MISVNEYKYNLDLNGKTLGVFNSFEKAEQCVKYLVEKYFDEKLKVHGNEGSVKLDIIPFYSGVNRGERVSRVLSGKNYSSKYSVKEEFKEMFKVEYQKVLMDLEKEIRLI